MDVTPARATLVAIAFGSAPGGRVACPSFDRKSYEFYNLYLLKWHYLARFGTFSKGLCVRKPYRAMS